MVEGEDRDEEEDDDDEDDVESEESSGNDSGDENEDGDEDDEDEEDMDDEEEENLEVDEQFRDSVRQALGAAADTGDNDEDDQVRFILSLFYLQSMVIQPSIMWKCHVVYSALLHVWASLKY